MKAYSADLRLKIVQKRQSGASAAEVARNFGLHVRTVERYWKRYQSKGQVYCKPRGGYRKSVLEAHRKRLMGWIEKCSDLTLAELCIRLDEQCGVKLSVSTLSYHIRKLGYTFKKNATGQRARSR